jgi:hypothetical protein
MRNYSFILTSPSGSEQLYRMGQFPDFEHAFCLAELIAGELGIAPNSQWAGWTMNVQDNEGSLVFSVPVGSGDAGTTDDAFEMTSRAA